MVILSSVSVSGVFLWFTVIFMGGAALLTGRALALSWRPIWQVVLSCLGLGVINRFFAYALFDASLLSVLGYSVDTVTILGVGMFSYRTVYVSVIVRQYPWLFERTGLLTYKSCQ